MKQISAIMLCVLAAKAVAGGAPASQPPKDRTREFERYFLRMCDLAAAELHKPTVPFSFSDRRNPDTTTHHVPFFEDGHAVRALSVAFARTGDPKYLFAIQRWADRMVAFQDRMIPAGAYYMNYDFGRAPGETRGNWHVADAGTIALGVLAAAVANADHDPQRYQTYLRSAKAYAKLVIENYTLKNGGITNGIWPTYGDAWWCSTATAGSLLLLLAEETGEEQYLRAGRDALEWMVRQDFRKVKPITFEERPTGIIFYCFELYTVGLRHLRPGTESYQLAMQQIAQAAAWMREHPIKQTLETTRPDDWWSFDLHVDMPGLPYLKYIFARDSPEHRDLAAAADEDLVKVAGWLFGRGEPPVSQLYTWEVMTWGMMSFAERLGPGMLFRSSHRAAGRLPGVPGR